VVEALQCPSCSTRYGLRAERVKLRHRRAQCFRCGGIFPIEQEVKRLLPVAEKSTHTAPHSPILGDGTSTMSFPINELPIHELPAGEAVETHGFKAAEVAAAQGPRGHELPSLTFGDLDGADEEILEKTLVDSAPLKQPEMRQEAAIQEMPDDAALAALSAAALAHHDSDHHDPNLPPEITETTLSGYTSARDAIDRLFNEPPKAPRAPMAGRPSTGNTMDIDKSLEALENTLGGIQPTDLVTPHLAPSHTPAEDAPLPSSTMQMSRADVLAAMAGTVASPAPAPSAETVAFNPKDHLDEVMENTQIIAAPSPTAAPATPSPAPMPVAASLSQPNANPFAPASEDPNLLRLRIGDDLYAGLSLDTIVQWIEEGRVVESHLVARQFSENWLEAYKVPGLRPVFDRIRKRSISTNPNAQGLGELPPPPSGSVSDTMPAKKSLFGGLFGRKDS
jgi:hypothetical protein